MAIGGRILFTIIILFVLAYFALVLGACSLCESIDRQMKRAYPLTSPPRGNYRPSR